MVSYADYLMIISPPQEIRVEIDKFKRASARKIGEFNSLHSKAHISIEHLQRCKPFMAQPIITRMGDMLGKLPPFKLQLNGFKHFESSGKYTIYAAMADDMPHNSWFRQLRAGMRTSNKSFTPHITIARAINKDAFDYLWPFFIDRPYQNSFIADRLTVLERETYVLHSNWRVLTELQFGTRLNPVY